MQLGSAPSLTPSLIGCKIGKLKTVVEKQPGGNYRLKIVNTVDGVFWSKSDLSHSKTNPDFTDAVQNHVNQCEKIETPLTLALFFTPIWRNN